MGIYAQTNSKTQKMTIIVRISGINSSIMRGSVHKTDSAKHKNNEGS